MVLIAGKSPILSKPDLVQASQPAVTSNTIQTPIIERGELSAPVDTLNTGSVTQTENNNLRTTKQVEEAFKSISIKSGLNTNELLKIIEMALGKSLEDLQNIDQKRLNDIIKHFNDTIDALQEDKIEVNSVNLEKYARLYNIQVQSGWDSIATFREANAKNSESLIARLYRMETGKKMDASLETQKLEEFKKLSTEQKAQKLEAYFDSYFNGLVKDGKNREEVDKLQLTDYTKLLFNSSPEEYAIFRDAIEYLVVNNRYKGYDAILESFNTIEEKTNFVKETPDDFVEKTLLATDQRGEISSEEQTAKFVAVHLKYADQEYIEKYHEEEKTKALDFYTEENKAKLAEITDADIQKIKEKLVKIEEIQAIQRKLEQGEEITAEEQALLKNPVELTAEEQETLRIYSENKYHKGDNAGQIIGITNNKVVSTEVKEELVITVNSDAYEIGQKAGNDFYREVLKQVVNYAESLPKEERVNFVALMEKSIGENYTKVENDIANGTTTELSAPKLLVENQESIIAETPDSVKKEAVVVASNNRNLGYALDNTVDLAKLQVLTAQLYDTQGVEEKTSEKEENTLTSSSRMDYYYGAYDGTTSFKKICEDFGTIEAIKYTFNKQSQNASAMLSAVSTFKGLACSQQFNTIKGLYSGLTFALENAKESTMERLQNVTLRTFGATKEARDAAEERLS